MQVQAQQYVLPSISLDSDTFEAQVCLEELVGLRICMCASSAVLHSEPDFLYQKGSSHNKSYANHAT